MTRKPQPIRESEARVHEPEAFQRHDGRSPKQPRAFKIERGVMSHAEGSAMVHMGRTRVLVTASVEERVPGWMRNTGKGWVTAEYAMLPRATGSRTPRTSQTGGRAQEIQRLIGRSLRAVTDLTAFGERTITVDCDVIEADGGTRTIDDQEIRVRGRQSATVRSMDGLCPRQRQQAIRMAVDIAHCRQFIAHRRQRGVMRIGLIIASLEHDRAVRCEAGEGVDVRVGIVALQFAGLQQHDLRHREDLAECFAQAGLVHRRMALLQADQRTHQRAVTVDFNRATFQREVDAILQRVAECAIRVQRTDQQIVARRTELAAPAGETKIEQPETVTIALRDRTGVTQPGIVVVRQRQMDACHVQPGARQSCAHVLAQVGVGDDDQQVLKTSHCRRECDIGRLDIGEVRGPVGAGMRPRDQDRRLGFPLGGELPCGVVHWTGFGPCSFGADLFRTACTT